MLQAPIPFWVSSLSGLRVFNVFYARSLSMYNLQPFPETQGIPLKTLSEYLQSLNGRLGLPLINELVVFICIQGS